MTDNLNPSDHTVAQLQVESLHQILDHKNRELERLRGEVDRLKDALREHEDRIVALRVLLDLMAEDRRKREEVQP